MAVKVIKKERKEVLKFKYNNYNKKTIVVQTITGFSFLTPLLFITMVFSTAAIGIALYLSLNGGDINSMKFAGLDNWKKVFGGNIGFGKAFNNSFTFAAISVPIQITVSLTLAAILNSKLIKGKNIFLAIYFLPLVTSGVASALIFNQLISYDGIIKIDPYVNPHSILYVAIAAAVWSGIAGALVLMNTAFGTIDNTQYEAAEIDGANPVKKFLKITIPSIGPIASYAVFTGIIGGLAVFDGPFLLAQASNVPSDDFTTLVLLGYRWIQPVGGSSGGSFVNVGLGTAILFVTSLIMMTATFVSNIIFPISKKTF